MEEDGLWRTKTPHPVTKAARGNTLALFLEGQQLLLSLALSFLKANPWGDQGGVSLCLSFLLYGGDCINRKITVDSTPNKHDLYPMKTMPYIIALVLAGSAFGSDINAVEDPLELHARIVKEREANKPHFDSEGVARRVAASREAPNQTVVVRESPQPSFITVREVNPGVWQASDGSTIRDMGYNGYTISRP